MSTANRVLKNTLILYGKTGITMFLSLYTTRVVLRELGAESFGVFALIGGIIAMFGFLNGSMAAATQRFMSYAHGKEDDSEQQDIFSISLVLHSVVAVIAVLLLLSLGPVLFKYVLKIDAERLETARVLYNVVAVSVIFPILAVPYQAVIIARENMLMLALIGFLESLLKFGVAISIAHFSGDKLLLYGVLMAVIPVALLITQGIVCHARYGECRLHINGIRNKRLTHEMLSFGGWSFLGTATSMLTQNGRGIVLNAFFGTTANAAEGITKQISGQLGTLTSALERALNPVITKREGSGRRQSMLSLVTTGSKITFFLKCLVTIPILLEMKFIFSVWLVDVPKFAITFSMLYLIENLISNFMSGLGLAISSVGKIKEYQISCSLIKPFSLLVSIALFNLGTSPSGIYYSFIFTSCVLLSVQIFFCSKLCSLIASEYILDVLLRSALAFSISILIASIPLLYLPSGFIRLTFTVGLSTFSTLSVFWFVNLNRTERIYLLNSAQGILPRLKSKFS